jgi:hypothetical protein
MLMSVALFETTVHGSRYPVKPIAMADTPISMPTIHMSSLGFFCTLRKYPRIMWAKAKMIMEYAE